MIDFFKIIDNNNIYNYKLFGGIDMKYIVCDCCGKTFYEANLANDPIIKHVSDLDFCHDCFKSVLEPAWDNLLKKSKNDIKVYNEKQYETAKACAKKLTSKK